MSAPKPLENLVIGNQYLIIFNPDRIFTGIFKETSIPRNPIYYGDDDDDDDPPVNYEFEEVYLYIDGRYQKYDRDITITQEKVNNGARVYDIYDIYNSLPMKSLPSRGHLIRHRQKKRRTGGVKSKKSKKGIRLSRKSRRV